MPMDTKKRTAHPRPAKPTFSSRKKKKRKWVGWQDGKLLGNNHPTPAIHHGKHCACPCPGQQGWEKSPDFHSQKTSTRHPSLPRGLASRSRGRSRILSLPRVTKPSHTPKWCHGGHLRSNGKVLLLLSARATSLSSHQEAGSPTPQHEERLQMSINTKWEAVLLPSLYLMFYLSCFLFMKLHFKIYLTNTYWMVTILFWILMKAGSRT